MYLIGSELEVHVYEPPVEVFDVTGAGDTVMATLATFHAEGYSILEATKVSALAAGMVVQRLGTSSIERNELDQYIHQKDPSGLTGKADKVVFTNGCFDILHIGHIRYLEKASKLGNKLIVGLNSDKSIRRIKGKKRPIVQEKDRKEILEKLEFVDEVIIFDETTPENLIKDLKPEVLVKGGDYKVNEIVGASFVKSYGGSVITIETIPNRSTTLIAKEIVRREIDE